MAKISIVLPVYNEVDNLKKLFAEIEVVMVEHQIDYEVIAANDGSRDGSDKVLREEAERNPKIKVINLSRNFGQTAAMSAGFNHASGEVIFPMDSDLQNDPADIPIILAKLNEGYDIVSGWRKNRKDRLLSKKIPSWIANYLISKITHVELHDYGCTLKAYRRSVLEGVHLYGEMHRFIPALAAWQGAKITEVVTHHRYRQFGKTKYGVTKTFRVVLDLLTVKFLTKYLTKPMHFFGYAGFVALFFGFLSGILAVYLREFHQISFIKTPLPLFTVFLIMIGVQFILMGLLAEILIRIYFESQQKPIYVIKEKINF